jgi:hypothetical protein
MQMKKPNIKCDKYDITVFLLFLLVVFITKFSTLNTPYYWDEMGWVRAAHWLSGVNLLRSIPGFHPPTTFWGHPPALHISLASLYKLFGESIWLSHLLILCFSFLGAYFTYLLGTFLYGRKVGIFSALFLFFSAIYFAQSGMFLGDIPVTALGVMSIYFALRKKYIPYLLCAVYMVMIKETAIAIIFSLLIYLFLTEGQRSKYAFREILKYGAPLLVIAAFSILQKVTTGKFCCIYSFKFQLFELQPSLVVHQAFLVTKWLFFYQYRYIFTFLIVLNLIINKASRSRKELLLFLPIFILSGYSFSFLYFLPRYLLPALPYFYMMAAWSLIELIKSKKLQTVMGTAITAVLIYSLSGTVLHGNYEWDMKYLEVVKIHKIMCEYIEEEFPNARVLTTFPHTEQLRRPYLGYVKKPLKAVTFKKERDFGDFDLILFSVPSDKDKEGMLRDYALRNDLGLIKRLEKDKIISELYGNRQRK